MTLGGDGMVIHGCKYLERIVGWLVDDAEHSEQVRIQLK